MFLNIELLRNEFRLLFQQELKKFYAENPIQVQQKQTEPKVVDLNGLRKHRPMVGSKSTIYKLVMSGKIPHSKRGKKLYFDLQKIDEWLLENEVITAKELEQQTFDYLTKKRRKNALS